MRAEYLQDPLGIDTPQPRLSWKLMATDAGQRGQQQSAYQILVATSPDRLVEGQADLWDSGWRESSQSHLVEYGGADLTSGMACWWQVRIKDQLGKLSKWSNTSRWSMGIVDAADWKAQWIGTDDDFDIPEGTVTDKNVPFHDPWFRKTFKLNANAHRAEMHVASIGYHELYVNGQKVSDAVLAPAVADHGHRARYVTYDVAPYLTKGKNVVAVWLGTSWSVYPYYQTEDRPASPIFTMQGDLHLEDGSSMRITTDHTWKTHPSPNRLIGAWFFHNYGGEHYDASKEIDDWNLASHDDSHWAPVAKYQPDVTLSAEMLEPNRLVKPIEAVSVERRQGGAWRVDMGVNFAGWLEVDVSGQPGTVVTIKSSERDEEAMTFRIHSKYVIGPSGKGTFRSRFNYHSGRWLTIEGLSRAPQLQEVRGYLVRSDFERTGHFLCSDDRVNRVYDTTMWTLENLCVGGYIVDCPQRERMGYGGDGHATILAALRNYGTAAFYRKWNEDFHDVQQPDGFVPYTAPTYWGGGGPAWSGFCVTLPWEVYRQHGDRRILVDSFPAIQRWLEFADNHSQDDLLVPWGSQGEWVTDEWSFLGDWVWPGQKGTNSHTPESLFFNNCYWVHNLVTAADIADQLNLPEEASRYRRRAAEVRKAIHAAFYRPEGKTYVNGFQGYLATALLADVPPKDARHDVLSTLEHNIVERRQGHIHAGITAGAMLFKFLMDGDRHDLIYMMSVQADEPGYLHMLDQGATTIWEAWSAERAGSRLHSSFLYVGAWPLFGLAGIRPGPEAGYQNFEIKPGVFATDPPLEWVSSRYDSDYGPIESNWQCVEGRFRGEFVVPPNTSAIVYLPSHPDSVTESGAALAEAEGVQSLGYQRPWLRLKLLAGQYQLEGKLDTTEVPE